MFLKCRTNLTLIFLKLKIANCKFQFSNQMKLTINQKNLSNLATDFQNFTKNITNIANNHISKLNSFNDRLQNLCNTNLDNNKPTVEVKGSNGAVYNVDLYNNTCTCPHFQYRLKDTDKICKHLEKVRRNTAGKLLQSTPLSPVSRARGHSVKVEGNNGNIYEVNNKTCTCPHFRYRLKGTDSSCKHMTQLANQFTLPPAPQTSPRALS